MTILPSPTDIWHHRKGLERIEQAGGQYALYYRRGDHIEQAGGGRFPSASLIKVPILLSWLALEREGQLNRGEVCSLDALPPVQGAGLSWLLAQRSLPYQDVLLLMIALSDNHCTNLVIERVGIERLNRVFREGLGLTGTELQRKLMDMQARQAGLDNWITASDAVRLYDQVRALPAEQRAFADSLLGACQDDALLMRCITRDTITFRHKTGSLTGVLHDWGYTDDRELFLLTSGVSDEPAAYDLFGAVGKLLES